jgi:hypothetical protein
MKYLDFEAIFNSLRALTHLNIEANLEEEYGKTQGFLLGKSLPLCQSLKTITLLI